MMSCGTAGFLRIKRDSIIIYGRSTCVHQDPVRLAAQTGVAYMRAGVTSVSKSHPLILVCFIRVDAWHTPSIAHAVSPLHFSWGFHRQGGLLLKRLDRFYVGHFGAESGGVISVLPGTSLSNHAPVSLCLLSRRSMAPCRGSRIPDSILQDTELRTALS
ncbi:hypothetical protein L7F22_059082 [Adiantum nelumboides]|nr:hypothetical protein [Adiantum nelumboides]